MFERRGRVSVSDLSVGSELLGYRVEGPLGRGGMSVVYLAEDLRAAAQGGAEAARAVAGEGRGVSTAVSG